MLLEKQPKDRDTLMHAQKLEIYQIKPFMSKKKLDNEQNIEQNR